MTLTRIALAPAMASFLIPFYCRYRDIADVLHQLAVHAGKCSASLRIYDPYFCEGSVVLHLRALGFTNVYNRNEDFYAQISGQCLTPLPLPLPVTAAALTRLLSRPFRRQHTRF